MFSDSFRAHNVSDIVMEKLKYLRDILVDPQHDPDEHYLYKYMSGDHIRLTSQHLGDSGVLALCQGRGLDRAITIGLPDNAIERPGGKAIAERISLSKSPMEINLSANDLTNNGTDMAEALLQIRLAAKNGDPEARIWLESRALLKEKTPSPPSLPAELWTCILSYVVGNDIVHTIISTLRVCTIATLCDLIHQPVKGSSSVLKYKKDAFIWDVKCAVRAVYVERLLSSSLCVRISEWRCAEEIYNKYDDGQYCVLRQNLRNEIDAMCQCPQSLN